MAQAVRMRRTTWKMLELDSGIPYRTLMNWKAGVNQDYPQMDAAIKLCSALRLTLNDLFWPDWPWSDTVEGEIASLSEQARTVVRSEIGRSSESRQPASRKGGNRKRRRR